MSIQRATLHQLRIFNELSRELSIARTARNLHLTPPAISIQVKQLSETIGEPLLEQVGKKLFLTEAGKLVAATCRDVFDRLEQLTQELANNQGMQSGSLRIAIITTAQYFTPRLLGDFCTQHPGIDVDLSIGNREAILERMHNNEDDLYILGQPPKDVRATAVPFAPNPLVAIAYAEHPLAGETDIPPQRLGEEPFIAREKGSGTRLATEDFFHQHKTELRIRMALGSNEAVKQAVAGRLGISLLSGSTMHAELTSGELVLLDVQGLPLERQWYVVNLEQKFLTPAALAFRSFLTSYYADSETA